MPKPEELGRDSASVEGQIYSEKGNTWPKVLKYNYETCGNKHLAIRHKYYGRWQGYTWADYYLNVKHLSLGLLALGFEVGDRTLIIGDNSPQRYYAELSVQVNHGISVGAYADSSPSEIQYLAENSELKFVVAQDQEQIDKLLEIKDKLPLLQKIIYWNYKGLAHYDDPILIGYEETLNLGREHEKKHPELFEQNVENGKDDDICAIVYTSGATEARPKGAIHTYKTAMANAKHYLNLDQWRSDDNVVPYLPPVGVPERWLGIGCHLLSANIMNLAEEPETLHPDTREIGPEVICYRARLWEARAALIQERMKGVDFLKRLAFRWLLPVGYKMADLKSTRQKPGLSLRILYGLANMVLFRPFRDSLGLSNARICYSTGSILSPDAFRLYHALNVPLKSVYCSAEGGALTGPRTDDIRFETVGPVHNSVEIQVSDEGEIICRQQGIFLGYYNDSEQTAKALKDGWFYSGDSGFFNEDEHLVFVDRIRDLVDIHGTDKLAPQFVESRLRFSPYIKDAWVMASPDMAYVAAVIVIDYDNVGTWAGEMRLDYSNLSDLSQKPEVYDLIKHEIESVNRDLSPAIRIKRYVNLHKEFNPNEGELTRTRELRRFFLEKRYQQLIEAIYGDKTEASVSVQEGDSDEVTAKMHLTIKIETVEGVD